FPFAFTKFIINCEKYVLISLFFLCSKLENNAGQNQDWKENPAALSLQGVWVLIFLFFFKRFIYVLYIYMNECFVFKKKRFICLFVFSRQ
ncbi:mCG125114, isoform CRA_c, partial [Mus musculus]